MDNSFHLDPPFDDSETGIYYDQLGKTCIWEETLERDDDCPRNVAIRKSIAAADFVLLVEMGIRPDLDWIRKT